MMMTRFYGASQLSSSIPWFLLHSTRDATVHITLIMSNVVVSLHLIIFAEIYRVV